MLNWKQLLLTSKKGCRKIREIEVQISEGIQHKTLFFPLNLDG